MYSYARFAHRGDVRLQLTSTVDNQGWHREGTEIAEYIEAYSSPPIDSDSEKHPVYAASNCRYGALVGDEILDWVTQSGSYAPMAARWNDRLRGGVRLLILERKFYQPPSFPIKKETYLAIEEQFHLPENTLSAFSNECGMSSHSLDVAEGTGTIQRLRMVMKATQKFQIGNYGLAFSHDFATGFSTGILHGTGVTANGRDFDLWSENPASEILEHLKTAYRFWAHPLCLPIVLLQHHLARADYFCTIVLSNKHLDIQRQLGSSRSGRLYGHRARNLATELPVHQARVNLKELTIEMSGLIFETTHFRNVSDWQCSCLKLLGEILTELVDLNGSSTDVRSMRATIRYLLSSAESLYRYNNGLRENSNADMNILYSIISQVDNRLNAKMAAAASRDSAAMKTIAFLTMLFLPGAFVASICSTGMFNWQSGGRVVSKLFWVYWAFTIPLTIAVGVGWRIWWTWEKKNFDADIKAEIEATEADGEVTDEVFEEKSRKGARDSKSMTWI